MCRSIALLVSTLAVAVPQTGAEVSLVVLNNAAKAEKSDTKGYADRKHATWLVNTALSGSGETVAYTGLGTIWAIRQSVQISRCISCDKEGLLHHCSL